jgi:hypothetical protein
MRGRVAAIAHSRFWHKADVPRRRPICPLSGRSEQPSGGRLRRFCKQVELALFYDAKLDLAT